MFAFGPGGTEVRSISILFDEGTDTSGVEDPRGVGLAVIDNIDVGGRLIRSGAGVADGTRDNDEDDDHDHDHDHDRDDHGHDGDDDQRSPHTLRRDSGHSSAGVVVHVRAAVIATPRARVIHSNTDTHRARCCRHLRHGRA